MPLKAYRTEILMHKINIIHFREVHFGKYVIFKLYSYSFDAKNEIAKVFDKLMLDMIHLASKTA